MALLVVAPLVVTDCRVLVVAITTLPVAVFIDRSVPATILEYTVAVVNTWAPATYAAVDTVKLLPMAKDPPIPTPPVTVSAPVLVPVLTVALVTAMALLVVAPRPVTVCSVLVFQIVTIPDAVLMAVSVPTPKYPASVLVVTTNALATYA